MTNFDPTADLTATTAELCAFLAPLHGPADTFHDITEAGHDYIGFDSMLTGKLIVTVESDGDGYKAYSHNGSAAAVLAAGATPVEAMRKAMGQ